MPAFTQWITSEIKTVCTRYRCRVGGSKSVRDCLDHMAGQLGCWADTVQKEGFTFHPHAFIGSIPLQACSSISGVLCFLLSAFVPSKHFALLSVLLFSFSLLSFILEYVLYRRAFDFLYPKKHSENVFAVRKASGETQRRIIICGHADAAFEMTFLLKMKTWLICLLVITADLGMLAGLVFGILRLALDLPAAALIVFGIIEGILLIAFVPFIFFADWRTVADGANDNLTGCYIGMSIIKEMAEKGQRFEHTDVCCLITDGEESGLRGAFAFSKAHRRELLDTNTIVIAADTIHDSEQLMIYHRGINFTQKNSIEVCRLLYRAGLDCNVELPYTGFFPGASDSEAFSRYGIKSAAICAVAHKPTNYYHTRFDSWDNMNEGCIELTRNIIKAAIKHYDSNGIEG